MTESEDKKVEIKDKISIQDEYQNKDDLSLRKNHPYSTFGAIERMFRDMNHWFDDFFWRPTRLWDFEPFGLKVFNEDQMFRTPLSNITDEGDAFNLTAELPGLDKGDLEITIHDGSLEIKGEKKDQFEDKSDGYLRREYSSSSYYRSFSIPEGIDEDNIDASLDRGVLKIKLPKKEEKKKQKKKIQVK